MPPDTPHTFRVVGQTPLRLLGIHANSERVTNYIGRESDAKGYPVFNAGERT
jgi:mannose-6-phosphate isomerase-like protein (cupin superfamily)